MLDQKKAESANYEALIKEAKNQAAIYTETIRQQNAAIKKIQEEEARKAAEEAKKKAAAAATNNKTSRNTSYATVITNATREVRWEKKLHPTDASSSAIHM